MPLATFLSGLSSLAGSGMAMVKLMRDDKWSRYPPEYLMYKDMMKMMKRGYPMGMMPGMMYPMNPYQMQVMMQQPVVQPPIIQPQPQQIVYPQQPVIQQQPPVVMNQQQLVSSIVQNVVANIMTRQQIPQQTMYQPRRPPTQPLYAPQQPQPVPIIFPQSMQLPTVTFESEPMWETSADGVAQPQPPPQQPMWLAPVPQPLALPPPSPPLPKPTTAIMQPPQPVRYVQVPLGQLPPEPKAAVQWCDPAMITNQVQPSYSNKELSWGNPSEFTVDHQGLQSFMDHIDHQIQNGPPPNYYGNVW